MKYDLLIKNGHVYGPQNLGILDIGILGEKIVAMGNSLGDASEVIDAEGKLVLPGLIETHAHMLLPFAGTITKNDFYDGTKAGAFGGVTTLIDFADQQKGDLPFKAIEKRIKQAEGKAVVDYSFHCTLTDINDKTLEQIQDIMDFGITSFKFYTIYQEDGLYVDDWELLKAFQRIGELGGLVTVHAENVFIVNKETQELISKGIVTPEALPLSEPAIAEKEAINRVLFLAKEANVPILIRHVSSKEGVNAIREAQKAGQQVYGETCPHYLTFTKEIYASDDGRNYIVHPPIREKMDMDALWQGIQDGVINVIGTDDCAFTREQKKVADVFYKIPGGMPGIETRFPVMFTEGVGKGRITLEKFVEITSTNVAKIYGLYPNKGAIQVGSDADLVVVDPEKEFVISWEKLHGNADWSPYDDYKAKGSVDYTIARGKIIVRGDEFLALPGQGNFIKRSRGLSI